MNQAGIDLVKLFEGCRLTSYQDQVGIWSIGYGCTHMAHGPGITISLADADALLKMDLKEIEAILLTRTQGIPLNENQFSALVSFCFNVGFGEAGHKDGFSCLKNGSESTLLKHLRNQDFIKASEEFPKWDKINGIPSHGILRRRLAEQTLFNTPVPSP